MSQNQRELAAQALKHLQAALDLCEGSGPVFEALEECRYALSDISEEEA
jgi:hypothetical protein